MAERREYKHWVSPRTQGKTPYPGEGCRAGKELGERGALARQSRRGLRLQRTVGEEEGEQGGWWVEKWQTSPTPVHVTLNNPECKRELWKENHRTEDRASSPTLGRPGPLNGITEMSEVGRGEPWPPPAGKWRQQAGLKNGKRTPVPHGQRQQEECKNLRNADSHCQSHLCGGKSPVRTAPGKGPEGTGAGVTETPADHEAGSWRRGLDTPCVGGGGGGGE